MRRAAVAVLALLAATPATTEQVAPARAAQLRALDRLSGELTDLEIPVGGSARFNVLSIRVVECRYPVANPAGDAYGFLRIADTRTDQTLFEGWMIASSPALNPFDHMRYDVWVLRCITS